MITSKVEKLSLEHLKGILEFQITNKEDFQTFLKILPKLQGKLMLADVTEENSIKFRLNSWDLRHDHKMLTQKGIIK